MNFEEKEIDDKKLMEQIDELDDNIEDNTNAHSNEKVKVEKEEKPVKKKKSFKENVVIVLLLVFVIIAYLCYEKLIMNHKEVERSDSKEYVASEDYYDYVYGSFVYYNGNYSEAKNDEFNILKRGIEINANRVNDSILLKMVNNNDEKVCDFDVYLIFYDENNLPISIKRNRVFYIETDMKYYIMVPNIPNKYSRYDILLSREYAYFNEPENLANQIKYEVSEKNSNDLSDVDIVQFEIIYFDENDEVIEVECLNQYNLNAGESVEIISKNEIPNHARYEVNLIYALNY